MLRHILIVFNLISFSRSFLRSTEFVSPYDDILGESAVTKGLKVTSSSTKFLELLIRSAIAILFAIVRGFKTAALIIVYFLLLFPFGIAKLQPIMSLSKYCQSFRYALYGQSKG